MSTLLIAQRTEKAMTALDQKEGMPCGEGVSDVDCVWPD